MALTSSGFDIISRVSIQDSISALLIRITGSLPRRLISIAFKPVEAVLIRE